LHAAEEDRLAVHGAAGRAMGLMAKGARMWKIFMANLEILTKPGRPLLPAPADNGRR
jgi:hypothetical protein